MKILGVGTDIVNVKRIERVVKKNKNSFLKKIFTDKEIKKILSYKVGQASKIASRFAAKEALSKSLATGIGTNVSFLDIEVLNKPSGAPYFNTVKKNLKKTTFELSLSDDYPWALAFVIAIKK